MATCGYASKGNSFKTMGAQKLIFGCSLASLWFSVIAYPIQLPPGFPQASNTGMIGPGGFRGGKAGHCFH